MQPRIVWFIWASGLSKTILIKYVWLSFDWFRLHLCIVDCLDFKSQGEQENIIAFLWTRIKYFYFFSNSKQLGIQRGSSTVIGILWKKLQIICFNTNGIWPQTKVGI